jgi:hypothetical protein
LVDEVNLVEVGVLIRLSLAKEANLSLKLEVQQ